MIGEHGFRASYFYKFIDNIKGIIIAGSLQNYKISVPHPK